MNLVAKMEEITYGSLFTGRGGFDFPARDLGIKTLWNCEIDKFLRNKLKRFFPDAIQYHDVRAIKDAKHVTIMSAGFPCQDISIANPLGKGIEGNRSGLWKEVARVANIVKPWYIILENSSELFKKGFETVLQDLSEIGYNAEWDCLSAYHFGYPMRRKRLYVIAYSNRNRRKSRIVFQPPQTYELSRKWIPTKAYQLVATCRANRFRDINAIQRGNVVQNIGREISAYGNAVMPVVAEHLIRCVIEDLKYQYENTDHLLRG
jgi:DNA (cytosine-5)-methyltransferase 1